MEVATAIERKLQTFENKILRKCCGAVFNANMGSLQMFCYGKKLLIRGDVRLVSGFVNGQRIQRLGDNQEQKRKLSAENIF